MGRDNSPRFAAINGLSDPLIGEKNWGLLGIMWSRKFLLLSASESGAGSFATGGIISVASIIRFITLFGIATRNGVMMIAHIRHLMQEEGIADPFQAVCRGAEERLIPILMRALAAGLALVPLALSAGQPGSEIQAPMAVVILFRLLSSTLLNMLIVPALYLRFGSLRSHPTEQLEANPLVAA